MRANGIPDAQWTLPLVGFISSGSQGAILGSIRKPTRARVESIARQVAHAIPMTLAMKIANVNIISALALDDCSPGAAQAEVAMIADARAKAKRIAAASGLRLGKLVGVDENTPTAPGCRSDIPQSVNLTSIDGMGGMYGSLDVTIEAVATVVFTTR
jgi:Protein of unknown function (DUF541)